MSNRTYLFDREIYDLSFNLHKFMNMELIDVFEIPEMVGKIKCCIQLLINSLSKVEKILVNNKQGKHNQREDRKMMMGIYRNTLHYMMMLFKHSVTNPECKANKQIKVLYSNASKNMKNLTESELKLLNALKSLMPKALTNRLKELDYSITHYKLTDNSIYNSLASVIGQHRMMLINIHSRIYDMAEIFKGLWEASEDMDIAMEKLSIIITYYYRWLDKMISIIEEAMEPLASDKIAHFNFKIK